ncbi:head maturation protease, ClpP-related [Streptomyces sp. NPDC019443]|uniref:head maturation protease, ClpP-related n=1 Tax=Streptomyces sp. NPDC019443 TaxID=3365061 RepID=UPI0037AF1724
MTRRVSEFGLQAIGPVPKDYLINQSLSAGARQAFLAAGRRQERVEGVAAGGRPAATIQPDRQWYKISNLAGGPVVVDIYDEIGYWGVMAAEFQRELSAITATEITVNLNSPGGEIFEGIAIYNALRTHPANVTVRVSSLAASIASVIAQAGDRIIMQTGSQMMIHEGSGLCLGDAADMRQMAELLDRQSDNIASIYAERAGGTTEEWRERMQAETWFNAEEAVAAGLADEVEAPARQEQAPAPEPVAARWDLTVFKHAGREHAPAPLVNTAPLEPAPVDTASGVHHTATETSDWDGPGAVAGMPNESGTLHYCHAWRDPDGDPNAKSTYKFPHHRKEGGPANMAAVRNGLARLASADIPEAERAGVEAHLRAHLKDGGGGDDEDHAAPVTAEATPEPTPEPDPWAALTAQLLTTPSWDDVTASLREASK